MVRNYSIKELSSRVTQAVFKWHLLSPQFSSVQFSSVQFSTVQYNSVQFNSVQYSTVQFSSVQFSLAQLNSKQLHGLSLYDWYGRCYIASLRVITWGSSYKISTG